MKIVGINSHPAGSTKTIMANILKCASMSGYSVWGFYGCWKKKAVDFDNNQSFGFYFENFLSAIVSKATGFLGCFCIFGTLLLVRRLKKIKPDIVHLHNLHLWTINVPILFRYLKKNDVKVIWTLHDCWAFTGRCPHFQMVECDEWKTGCNHCNYPKNKYPSVLINRASTMWKLKRALFADLPHITIVTPSVWLSNLVKASFLKEKKILVINNGIDLSVFKPVKSDFRSRYNILSKHIVLGVAYDWGYSKGLDVFLELSSKLNDDYLIVLVGTDDKVDMLLPSKIISIHRTQNKEDLVAIYSSADVFLNPTREDNYPTVNMESLACGCPVITFNTGGSAEMLTEKTGIVLSENTIDQAYHAVRQVCESGIIDRNDCVNYARIFDMNARFNDYVELYNSVMKHN